MKTLILSLFLVGCAQSTEVSTQPQQYCYTTWSCGWNASCYGDMNGWHGVNAQPNVTSCQEWRNTFLSYNYSTASSCSCN